ADAAGAPSLDAASEKAMGSIAKRDLPIMTASFASRIRPRPWVRDVLQRRVFTKVATWNHRRSAAAESDTERAHRFDVAQRGLGAYPALLNSPALRLGLLVCHGIWVIVVGRAHRQPSHPRNSAENPEMGR